MTFTAKLSAFLLIVTSFLLVGCPGSGDRLKPDELTSVRQVGSDLCFLVSDARDYQPTLIAISTRAAQPQEWTLYENPSVIVTQGELCISPSFYRFLDDSTYVVRYILQSKKYGDLRRSVVSAIAFTNGSVRSVPLRKDEAAYY
ncbi:putative T6SS immunity periplasmic lipoprotein [Pectobacterium versatile]|uniref:putative T6SS immunity periplasmic lipoprotein n=1 Tax=Pectobacterium versatile TaxID=2488639 RepID=UPI0037FEF357